MVAELTAPPRVPAPITRNYPTIVTVNLEVVEKEMEIADGTTYDFWTFGGTVPGSFIRVREGDRVVFNLINAEDSAFPHNIDLHAVTGPGGGAAASLTMPGQGTTFEFAALNPGLYVYHCAIPGIVGTHIANGMYGLILVEDADNPLPIVDHEFYVMQDPSPQPRAASSLPEALWISSWDRCDEWERGRESGNQQPRVYLIRTWRRPSASNSSANGIRISGPSTRAGGSP